MKSGCTPWSDVMLEDTLRDIRAKEKFERALPLLLDPKLRPNPGR